LTTSDARCSTREIKSGTAIAKPAFNKETFYKEIGLKSLREKLVKRYTWSVLLYSAEKCTLRRKDQKYIPSSEMWCWRKMEKINWSDRVRN
jgi:hypothetical protein